MKRRTLLGAVVAVPAQALHAQGTGHLLKPWPKALPTPALKLPLQDGGDWTLASAAGHPVVLNFWASWCEPCRAEMPTLELLAARHEREGLQVLAINFRETDDALQRFLQSMPISLPILRDRDGAAARAWQARVFPTTVLVGRNGRAVLSVIGEADWMGAEARRWIAPLL